MATVLRVNEIKTIWPFNATAAIFDFDGTIADSLDVWKRVDDIFFERRGIAYKQNYAETLSVLGFEEGAQYTIKTYGLNETVDEICAEWNELGRTLYKTEVELRPYALEYIKAIKQKGAAVGLATTNRPYVLEAVKPRIDLDRLFEARVYGCEVSRPTKQDPDIYLECAQRLNRAPQNCVVFEDIATGLRSAKKAGMTTVGVLTDPRHQNAQTLFEAADYVIESWEIFKSTLGLH